MSRSETSSLLYLYCIINPDSGTTELLSAGGIPGVEDGEPLFVVESAGLLAAVSHVPSETFSEEPLNELLTDLPRLAPYAIRHEQAIRDLCEAVPALLPMTFGMVYRSEAGVQELLKERAGDFHARLARLRGQQEWEIKVFRRPAELLAAAAASTARRSEPTAAGPDGPGRAYLLQRLHERRSAEEAARMAAEMLGAVRDRIGAVSSSTHLETVDSAAVGDVGLVCRLAALVPATGAGAFRRLATDLTQQYEPLGMALELSGPWAPYSFVTDDDDA